MKIWVGRLFVVSILAALVFGLSATVLLNRFLDSPMNLPASGIILEVAKGSHLKRVSRDLARLGVIDDPRYLSLGARLSGQGNVILAGEYRLDRPLTPRELLLLLASGQVIQYSVTLIEGWTLAQAVSELGKEENLLHELSANKPDLWREQLGVDSRYERLEGLFAPDTYYFHKGMSDVDVLKLAHKQLLEVLEEEWQHRAENLPFKTAYEGLVLASIIEKETGLASERGRISAVFVNRLRRAMRLQTDPTVIYGLGDTYQGNLTRKHLRQKTAYNTYVIKGLPPSPIALAGRESIHAAFNPLQDDSLFFVAVGDGSHYFSTTIEEHNKAVREYQKFRRSKTYRSSPKREE